MNKGGEIIDYFRKSELVPGSISKHSSLIIFNCIILLMCALFETFGVGLLAPVLQSIQGSEEGGGLHNIAASLQIPSPEFADLPTTQLGVPVFSQMTDDRKKSFLRLCGIQI